MWAARLNPSLAGKAAVVMCTTVRKRQYATALRGVLAFVRDVEISSQFYEEGLKLRPKLKGRDIAVFEAGDATVTLQPALGNEAMLSHGYGPFLEFDVTDMDFMMHDLMRLGGHLDGPISYQPEGKVAVIRSPDGHMISLRESDQEYLRKLATQTEAAASSTSTSP